MRMTRLWVLQLARLLNSAWESTWCEAIIPVLQVRAQEPPAKLLLLES